MAPGWFTFADSKAGATVRIEPDGTRTELPPDVAITLDDRPFYLSVFGTGIRNRSSLDSVQATIGGAGVTYAGSTGEPAPGLDQVTILLTAALKWNNDGRLVVTVDGVASNTALVDVH